MRKQIVIALGIWSIISSSLEAKHDSYQGKFLGRSPEEVVGRMLSDVGSTIYNFFSIKTLKVFTGGIPFYLLARPIDQKVHYKTYDAEYHKNKHEPAQMFTTVAINAGCIAIPIAFAGFFSSDPYRIRRAEIFTTGVLLTWGTKNLIKLIPTQANERPWNEHFSNKYRAYGGNPSGHTALLGYCLGFWAAEKGAVLAIPLSALMAVAMGVAVAANRHYTSQVILGATFGIAAGLAAHTTFERAATGKSVKVNMVADRKNGVGVRLSYAF